MTPHRSLSLLTLLSLTATGADQTYDDSSSSDLWDTTTSNWDGSTSVWTNGNTAIFGGTGETVTVDTVSAAGITINSTGYTLDAGSISSSGTITANASATINSNISLAAGQAWSVASGGTLTLGGVTSGSNTLTYGGAGSYIIGGINTNSGNLTIDAATVTVNSGATLFGSGLGWSLRSVTIRNGGSLSADNYANGAGNFWGQVGDGSSNIILESGGVLEMTNTMGSGVNKGISVTAGETGSFAVPTGSDVSWTGAYSGRDFNSNSGSTLVFDIDGSFSTTRYLRGAGGYTKTGSGTFTLDQTNSFTGTLTISEGILDAAKTTTSGNASALGGGSTNIVVNSGGTLLISGDRGAGYHGGSATIHGGTITLDGNDLSFVNGNTLTFDTAAGTIDGTGFWRRRESGNKVAVTTAASGSTISVATLNLFDNSPTFEVADGAAAADLTISSAIDGGSNLVKTGTGTLVIDGVSTTYTGTTQVNAGTLQVDGTLSGAVNVASGATLSGSGSLGGATTNSGTLAPGNSPGILGFDGGLTLTSTSIFEWELFSNTDDLAKLGSATDGYDGVDVTGNASVDGTFRVLLGGTADFDSTFWQSDHTWENVFDVSGTTNGSFSSFELWNNGAGSAVPDLASHGSFSFNSVNGSLSWSAIPEPASALVGLLLSAGLLHRRRPLFSDTERHGT